MEKIKICPACGAKNAPNRIECAQCEADITGIPVTVDAPENQEATHMRFVRICDCGAKNPAQARRCAACGEDISDIVAVEDREDAPESKELGQLVSLDGMYVYGLCEGELTIGRGHDLGDYLNGFCYVSRNQAHLAWQEGDLVLTSLSRSNPTFVNNQPLDSGQSVTLRDGDEIGLGGCVIDGRRQEQAAYLVVRLPQ